MSLRARPLSLCASLAWFALTLPGLAHVDAVRMSLAQLFLESEIVVLARIEAVADRNLGEEGQQELLEVVTATVVEQFKGEPAPQVDFFLDAHGPAHYQAGDIAVLFLEKPGGQHPLSRYVAQGKLDYISQQVRNTEHIVATPELADYQWLLGTYSESLSGRAPSDISQTKESILLRMLDSASPALVESALIDWQNTGAGLRFDDRNIKDLIAITREDGRPINLRLAILRTMASQQLVGPEAWDALFAQNSGQELVSVIRSTRGFENNYFAPALQALLDSPSEPVAETAARSLGHPVYRGSEAAVGTLLESDSQRLNYAAIAALIGISSQRSQTILQEAGRDHPDEKVRRQIDARLGLQD